MIVHFYQVRRGGMKDCETSLQCKYFFNYLIGFTSLTSFFLFRVHLQQLITFTVFAFTFFDQVANRAAGDRRAPESRSARNVAPSSSPALCSAPFCWRPSSLPTPDPRTVGCALCKYICFSVAFQFAFFVILFHYLSFFSVVILLLPQQEQPQELWLVLYICITWLNVLTLQTHSTIYVLCVLVCFQWDGERYSRDSIC